MSDEANKPVHHIRLSTISAAIFKNTNTNGQVHYNAVIDRSYKEGDQWKHTTNLGRDDLLYVSKVADLANSWILATEKTDRADRNSTPEPN